MDEKVASSVSPSRLPSVKAKIFKGGKGKGAAAGALEPTGRMKGTVVVKPVVYGNVAWYLGDKQEEDGHTHQWSVYLRSYNNEDMSVYVKKVQFKLHESYAEPIRIVHAPPYSITETGWGEFEIAIKIFFHDSNERPATVYHFLKLFERDEDSNVKIVRGPLNSEIYDELVFIDPNVRMYKLLNQSKPTSGRVVHKADYEQKKVDDLKKILEAKTKIKDEIQTLKERLKTKRDDVVKMRKIVEQQQ